MHVPNLRDDPRIVFPACPDTAGETVRPGCAPLLTLDRAPWRVSLASIASAFSLLGLIGGLGYGSYALLQDLQRAGFAPVPLASAAFAEAPLIAPPAVGRVPAGHASTPDSDWENVFLSAATGDLRPPVMPARDGPISAIDPESSGLFAPNRDSVGETPAASSPREAPEPPRTAAGGGASPDGPNGGTRIRLTSEQAALAEPALAGLETGPPKVVLHATDEAWIRVRDGEAVIFEGILPPGGQYQVPERARAPLLRAGNAGALYVMVDNAPYGPIGTSAAVLKNMSLRAGDITGRIRSATASAVCNDPAGAPALRTAVNIGQ